MANTVDTYLFRDGEYLRRIYREGTDDVFGVDGDLDPGKIRHPTASTRSGEQWGVLCHCSSESARSGTEA